jgi:TonB family protein
LGKKEKIMCCKSLWKTITPFAIAFLLGILAASLFQKNNARDKNQLKSGERKIYSISAVDYGGGRGIETETVIKMPRTGNNQVLILQKPRAKYTDAARKNLTQGTVSLKVEFLADGKIGDVKVVKGLEGGLNEEAITAAKQIFFEPATRNGKPVSVVKTVEYNFYIY